MYCMWENFGGGKFWRIITDEANGEENFGESAGRSSVFITLANCTPFAKFAKIFPHMVYNLYV